MIDFVKKHDELKRKVAKASYDVFIKNNPVTRDAYDKAIEELMEFEDEFVLGEEERRSDEGDR